MSLKGVEPRILATCPNDQGYPVVVLYRGSGEKTTFKVHILIALTFLGPTPPGLEVRHDDGNKLNNHISNLIWGTSSQNNYDQVRHGTHPEARRTHCDSGHEFTDENIMWRWGKGGKTGGVRYRKCKTCHARYVRECRWRKEGKAIPELQLPID